MERINFLMTKFLWRYPGLKRTLAIVILLIGIAAVFILAVPEGGLNGEPISVKEFLTIKFVIGMNVLLVCFILYIWLPVSMLSEDKWRINGYVIQEAERILKENPEFKKLEELIGDAKIKEGVIKLKRKDGLKKNKTVKHLKKWIDNFREYEKLKALGVEYKKLKDKEMELAKKILGSRSKFSSLREELGIVDEEWKNYWICMSHLRKEVF